MSNLVISGALGIFVGAIAFGCLRELRRRRSKRQRFADRELLPLDEIYSRYYANSAVSKECFARYWVQFANLLRADTRTLRPSDRFDVELAPVSANDVSDELEDLRDFVDAEFERRGYELPHTQMRTLDDVLRRLCGNHGSE